MKRNAKAGVKKNRHVINDQIEASEVRLISADGEQLGIVPLREAIEKAQEAGLDLVQISNADPVVAKIMDLGKKLYEEKKAKAAAKKKQSQVQVKEVKFRPNTDIGDYNVKLRNLSRFLEEGNKAKVTLRFRGREMAHQELGMELLKRVETDLEDIAQVELRPKMEGRQLTMVLAPTKKK
ncbi:translation initiation factor IF-3 [Reinekea blandensis]|uniref:translation initiation factor IF-3 n=1 Tax=Reinekea blandensis TaxID=374838 RepID=UPI000A062E49|nr:translation initiation factor IF-3 [Reinekea blandensis]